MRKKFYDKKDEPLPIFFRAFFEMTFDELLFIKFPTSDVRFSLHKERKFFYLQIIFRTCCQI